MGVQGQVLLGILGVFRVLLPSQVKGEGQILDTAVGILVVSVTTSVLSWEG